MTLPMALALWQELAYLGAQVDLERPLVELAAQKPLAQAGSVGSTPLMAPLLLWAPLRAQLVWALV